MRYEDASHTGAFQGSQPIANDDLESLAAGSRSAATGNLITGEGTQTGSSGADAAAGAHITAIAGKSGEDTSFSGGKLSVSGEHGKLSVDAEGNYLYQANAGVENVRDRFTYTLADNNGATDTASLIVEIGKTPVVIKADAQQIVPGPDGVVTLPPGVELSDIRVVGRDLVIDLPNGSQMIIVDGAIFVPQLVLDGVEVPSTNLAALLIGQEPQPAAGELPQSSGGNFDVPVPPLDPGVPLGDLIPPTEYTYTPPEPQEVLDELDRDPEIFIQPDGQPASVAAVDSVDEDGLPTRNGNLPNEPAGSDEGADGNPSNNSDTDETTGGLIIYNSPDGVSSIVITGFGGDELIITGPAQVGQTVTGQYGTLTITSVVDGQIGYSYTLADNTSGDATHDDFSVVLTDEDGDTASATLTINVIDDVPTARNDTDASVGGVATGNVMTDAAPGDVGDSDTNAADTVGADNATLTAVSGAGGSDSTFSGGLLNVNGQFGSLTIDAQGNYTYTVNPNVGGGGVDVFTYTLTDGDGDISTATLTITNPDLQPNLPDPAAVLLDDDALANGIPGGTLDDADSSGTPGVLAGTGGDGDLDYAFAGPNTLPAGFTVNTVNASTVQILQGGTVVLTVTLNTETGAFTVVQNNPIDHAAGLDENNVSFGIGVQVVDADGDVEPATITINVDDDTPEMNRADVSLPTLTVDETNLAVNASADYSVIFAGAYGADGPGTTSYAVSVVNGTDSGLVDVATGLSVLLYNVGGVVTGSTAATLAEVNAGNTVFTVSVGSGTGVVALDQIRAVSHPDVSDPDDPVSPAATSIQLTATITDGDGDSDSLSANIGSSLVLEDDGPSVSPTGIEPNLVVDESDLTINETQNFADAFAEAFGADGPADSNSASFALGINAGATGLVDTLSGDAVVLSLEAGVVVGRAGPGGPVVFTVSVNAAGDVVVDQQRAVVHADPTNPDDVISLATDNLITISATVTDRDGDSATATLNIGNNVQLEDDGPSIGASSTQPNLIVDETNLAANATASFAGIFTADFGEDGPKDVDDNDVADADAISYQLDINAGASGLIDTLTGDAVVLTVEAGTIVGRAGAGGPVVFVISVDGSGNVTLDQQRAVVHDDPNDADESSSPAQLSADNLVTLTATITDGDGDQESATANIGLNFLFEDDGPSIDGDTEQLPSLTVDETNFALNASANFAAAFTSSFGADGPKDVDDNDVPDADAIGFALGINAGSSGLVDTLTGAAVVLTVEAGTVVGRAGAGGPVVFVVSVDGSGNVTLDQQRAVVHDDPSDADESTSPAQLSAANLVTLTATIIDGDGDRDTATIDIGQTLNFEDDGPSIDVTATNEGSVLLTTQDAETIGAATDQAASAINFSGVFGVTSNGGADGTQNVTTSYTLAVANSVSGLSSHGVAINLYNVGGVIVGSTAGVAPANLTDASIVFTVEVDGSGLVTVRQMQQIDHSVEASPLPGTDAPFDDQLAALADGRITLTRSATITDGDGDTATDNAVVDLGGNILFADHGPIANDDVDSIVSGGDIATGNVITGADTVSGAGGADSSGADAPATIVGVVGAVTSDTNPAGGFVAQGNFGVLTMQADGSYSYDRNDGAPGNAQDIFTYTLRDFDGDTDTATLTINISDAAPVLLTPAPLQLDDDNAQGVTGNPGGPNDDAVSVPLSGTLSASGGDGDLDFFFNAAQTAPAGFTYNVTTGATTQTLEITQTSTGLVVTTVTLTTETGAYTVVQNNPVSHDTQNGIVGLDNTENNTPNFNIAFVARDVDNDPSNVVNLVLNIDDDTPVLSNVAAGVGVTLDETTAGTPAGFPISLVSASAAITATQAFGADGAAAANSVAYGLSIVGDSPELTALRTAVGDHLITLVQIDANTIQGQYNGTNVAFQIDIGTDGRVTLTQNVPLEHNTDGSSAAAHDDSLDLSGFVNATITITDSDGDSTSALAPIGNQLVFRDDGPDAQLSGQGAGTVTLDESRPVDTDTLGGTAPNGDDQATINFAAAFVTGGSVDFGADGGAASNPVSYALVLTGTNVLSGLYAIDGTDTETAIDGYGRGAQIVLNQTDANTVTGSVGATNYFTITIDPATGIATFTQLDNIWHPNAGSTAAAFDDPATLTTLVASALRVIQTVTDSDGDTDTAEINIGQGVFIIQDDGPQAIQPDAASLENEAGASVTADLDDDLVDSEVISDFGEDLPGLVQFANIGPDGHPSGLTSNDDAIEYWLSNNGQTLQARTNSTNGTDGQLIFTVQINQATGDYTVTMTGTIDNGSGVTFDNLTSTKAGNVDVRGVGADDPLTTVDLLLTASSNGANATINTSNATVGSANQSMDQGETVRIDFVSNLEDDPADDLATFPSGFSYDGHVGTQSFLQLIPQVQGNQPETVAFRVYALNTTVTDAASPDDTPVAGPTPFSDSTVVAITHVTVDGFDDGPDDGTPNQPAVTVAIGAVGVWTTIAYGVSARLESDGSVTFSGIQQGDQYGIETGTDFNAIAVSSLPVGIGPAGNLSTMNSFDLGVFSIGRVDSGDPIDISFDLSITDADGDTIALPGAIDITFEPAVETLAATSFSSQEEQLQKSAANSNTLSLAAAVAAAGLVESAAATPPADTSSFDQPEDSNVSNSNQTVEKLSTDDSDGGTTLVDGTSNTEAADGPGNSSGHGRGNADGNDGQLDAGASHQASDDAGSQQAANDDQGPAEAVALAIAPTVGMPSAEALQAAGLTGDAKQGGSVEQIVAEALGGGSAAETVDAILDALAGANGNPGAIADLASPPAAAVPAWDMATHGAFSGGADMMFNGQHVAIQHHDAVQPVING